MVKIGLTGNIASGKSEVEKIFLKKGFIVVDLDKISHQLLENNDEVRMSVLNEFNTLNRIELAKIVFSDLNKKKILEDIIYPKLKEYIINLFKINNDKRVVVVSGALIYEAGFDVLFDKIIFVDANKDLRLKRLMKRNNLDKETALKRIDCQNDDNKTKADIIIENNSDIKDLNTKINNIISLLF